MLNFKNSTIITLLLVAAWVAARQFFPLPGWSVVIIPVLYSLLLFYGSYNIQSQFYLPVICNGGTQKNQVALTFDDGPVAEQTAKVLDILKNNQVNAAFFCIGNQAEAEPGLMRRMTEEGHLVSNHSFSHHFLFDLFTRNKMKAELQRTNEEIQKATGVTPRLFRPPYGVTTPVLAKAITESGMIPVGWSLRSLDTIAKDEQKLISKIGTQLKPGDIILLHDRVQLTVNALQQIIDTIRNKGFEIVRLDQLINEKAYV